MSSIFFLSAFGSDNDAGVYTYTFDEKGKPVETGFAALRNSGYLALSPDRKTLYATCAYDNSSDGTAAFRVASDGTLVNLLGDIRATGGKSSCHVCTSLDGKFVYVANYSSGSVTEFPVNPDGSLAPRSKVIRHYGSGPFPGRQKSAHAHQCYAACDGKFIAVVDLGCDSVFCYPYDQKSGINKAGVIENKITPAGSGPRHLVFDKSGKRAYLLNELGNTLFTLHYSNGKFEIIDRISTLPRGVECATKAAAVRLSKDGKYLIATNRGFDSVIRFDLSDPDKPKGVELQLVGGVSPRDAEYLGGGKYFAVNNEFSDSTRFFDCNPKTGALTPNGYELITPRPLCLLEL